MVARLIRKHLLMILSLLGLGLLLLSLLVLSQTNQNLNQLSAWYPVLLAVNGLGIIGLLIVIGYHLRRLVRNVRRRQTGSRLQIKVLVMFIVLAVLPLGLVYSFSVQFIGRGVDSHFNTDIETALDSAVLLSQASLDRVIQRNWYDVRAIAKELGRTSSYVEQLQSLRARYQADVLVLMERPYSTLGLSAGLQDLSGWPQPSEALWRAGLRSIAQVELQSTSDSEFRVHAIAPIPNASTPVWVFAVFDLDPELQALARQVQSGYDQYNQVSYLRQFLQTHFVLTLSLALLVSVLVALWGALVFARRLTQPIEALALGTQAVAQGNFSVQLPNQAEDELGLLVEAFNSMTQQLASAQRQDKQHQQVLERERSRLAIMLAKLSSGVLVVGEDLSLRVANPAASQILDVDLNALPSGTRLTELTHSHPALAAFVERFQAETDPAAPWQGALSFLDEPETCHLVCTSTPLPTPQDQPKRMVIVIDDVTRMLQAQRQAAWGEVARRLAHEIKNPLTPIQLAAERLENHYTPLLNENERGILHQSTATIVEQVGAMKTLVNAFSDYAQAREMHWEQVNMGALLEEMQVLYNGQSAITVSCDIDSDLGLVYADASRWRQILHNLIKNAKEATHDLEFPHVLLTLRKISVGPEDTDSVVVQVSDNGPGLTLKPEDIFKPYLTTKHKGTGLGLAIVKKLVEEHGGSVSVVDTPLGGASIECRFAYRTKQNQAEAA